jgi:transposase-like protein
MIAEAYVSGVSQRKMGEVTEALMGEQVSRSTVSRVAKRLDEAVDELRTQLSVPGCDVPGCPLGPQG